MADAAVSTLTYKIKAAMRISSTNAVIIEEINDNIAACKLDLQLGGVVNIDEQDALIIRAITLYCKAEFGYSENSERFRQSYEMLKMSLCLAGDYNTKIVTETDTATSAG